MNRYFFILGRNPTLSIAEIIAYFKKQNVILTPSLSRGKNPVGNSEIGTQDDNIIALSDEVLIVSTDNPIDPFDAVKTLGGTVKLGIIIDETGLDEDETKFQQIFSADNLKGKYLTNTKGKLHFGISIYNAGDNKLLNKLSEQLGDLNVTIKRNLQDAGLKAGFLRIKDRYLSSVSVAKNRLLDRGAEVVIILTNKSILIGKTLIVQEFESFSFRDYGRPQRDKRSGIIPPKLARMMINLAAIDLNQTILDPFCGSGTIIQEAIILGYRNIIASDISKKAVEDTKGNIDWLFANFQTLNRLSYNIKIEEADVRSISNHIPGDSIDAVVTEPFLGPPLYKKLNPESIKNIFSQLCSLYIAAFNQFARVLKPGGKVVIVFPAFEVNGQIQFFEIIRSISDIGFKEAKLLPPEYRSNPSISLSRRDTILYGDKDQFILRELLAFNKS